ncbi:MAG: nucleotidyltransferase domain-containing protein [Tepidanaerobacteraceae bacterium]|jgi:predicted nucleotidyltransferase|nr:nucleotidyltransferase domain-containing protein [Tepidanaerobacter sp.]HQA60857.1 nucleotidyltransferase domain-containing protein [Tepidanaerobacteraceae bacterium]HQE06465.1 nucleotidyltransferase domain-containing protein [Tepidanaerobacteraceae bacterium]
MKRNLKVIETKIQRLKSYAEKNENIVAVYIFGSYGTKHQHFSSDMDFAVLFKESVTLFEELEIESDISQIFERDDIDLVNLNKAAIDISHQVLYTGDLLFCRDEILLADFKEKVFNIYGDYGIVLKKFYDDYQEGLREEYGGN